MTLDHERGEYRRLQAELNAQARGIVDRLLVQEPGAVAHLGPQIERYVATKRDFDVLMLRELLTGSWYDTTT